MHVTAMRHRNAARSFVWRRRQVNVRRVIVSRDAR
jgi:hypothetical protein